MERKTDCLREEKTDRGKKDEKQSDGGAKTFSFIVGVTVCTNKKTS